MKHTRKKVGWLGLALSLGLLLLTGCKDKPGSTTATLSAQAFADLVYCKVPLDTDLTVQSGDTMALLMNLSNFSSAAGYTASGNLPDMVAVFCGADEASTKTLSDGMSTYLSEMVREYERYAPEQVAKLEDAVVLSAGNYAVLCVTPDAKTAKQIITDIFDTGTCTLMDLRSLPQGQTTTAASAATTAAGSTLTTANGSVPSQATTAGTQVVAGSEAPIAAQGDFEDFGAVVRDGDTVYECYYYNDKYVTQYADAINKFAATIPATAKVYDLLIPTSAGITLPDALVGQVHTTDQNDAAEKAFAKLSAQVQPVRVYSTLRSHRAEYIYFRSDHHWTARGSYYAFSDYCTQRGVTAPPLSGYETKRFSGFLGSFYKDTKQNAVVGANPDTVEVFYPLHNAAITLQYTDTKGAVHNWPLLSDVTDYAERHKYSTFAGGDNPKVVTTNADLQDGSACILIKESFGNALIPYLADCYQNVYAFDYRYDTSNLATFVAEHPNADVLFANNMSALQSSYLVGKLSAYLQ